MGATLHAERPAEHDARLADVHAAVEVRRHLAEQGEFARREAGEIPGAVERGPHDRDRNVAGVVEITTGVNNTCARLMDGTAKCWGYNTYGQIGDGTTTDRTTPVPVLAGANTTLTNIVQISSYYTHTCALLANKTIVCWGYNTYGQIGDGTTTNRSYPVTVLWQ